MVFVFVWLGLRNTPELWVCYHFAWFDPKLPVRTPDQPSPVPSLLRFTGPSVYTQSAGACTWAVAAHRARCAAHCRCLRWACLRWAARVACDGRHRQFADAGVVVSNPGA
jgi:hypothetical protein